MRDSVKEINLTRRGLLGGAAILVSARHALAAIPAPSAFNTIPYPVDEVQPLDAWLAYNDKLRARLADAGGGRFRDDFSIALLQQTNSLRSSFGLAAYDWDEGLATSARAHAADMAARRFFAHASPEGFTHLHRTALLSRDLCGRTSENLAWREFPGGTSPKDVEALWEESPAHRHNLLRPDYATAGYGVVQVEDSFYAAAVYARATVRLGHALPLWLQGGSDLRGALSGASPIIQHLTLTRPFQPPTWSAPSTGLMPSLQEGVWQLRPLQATGDGRFDVVSGPLFFVD